MPIKYFMKLTSMKDAKNIGALTAVVFAIGVAGFSFSDGLSLLQSDVPSSTMEAGAIMGHMEIIHADENGNIISYQQTDNAIVNEGRNCTVMALFGPGSNTSCDDHSPGPYNVVGIGNGSALTVDTTATTLNGEIADNNMARANAVVTVSQVSAATASSDPAVARISAVFTWQGATTNTVSQAGLFNQTSTTNDSTFALKNFPSNVAMNTNDQLTVNWDITIDGSDNVS